MTRPREAGLPDQGRENPLIRAVRRYFPAVWATGNISDILLVNGTESVYLRRNSIPVQDITAPDIQIISPRKAGNLPHSSLSHVRKHTVGFVQDTEEARRILNKRFKLRSPSVKVMEDPNFKY